MARRYELGKLRRSQVITTWGPGAIVDFRAGGHEGAAVSVVAAGLDEWDRCAPPVGMLHPQSITEPRLQARLRVEGFRLPPVEPEAQSAKGGAVRGHLIGVRFPQWLQCPECHLLQWARSWHEDKPGDPVLVCPACTARAKKRVAVVPVRFIVACEDGHLDEFPWGWWVGHKAPDCKGPLELRSHGGAGLANLVVHCRSCHAARSLSGIFSKDALKGLTCRGHKPWLGTAPDGCEREPRVLQRGASNLYFSVVVSALDIPPWSDRIQHALGSIWGALVGAEPADRLTILKSFKVDTKLGMPLDQIAAEVDTRLTLLQRTDPNALRWEEYERFVSDHKVPLDAPSEFEVHVEPVPPELRRWFGRVVRATRLREVRVLRGFTRIHPPMGERNAVDVGPRIAPIQAKHRDWLPAIEVRGEGIFLELDREELARWEDRPDARARAGRVDAAYREMWRRRFGDAVPPPRRILPRTLVIHSLAHVLMRQLALTCGYPSASLRERLYVDEGEHAMCGLLIYTATPDSEGTLGGLVRQGAADRLVPLIEQALTGMTWCSSDPLCIQGAHSHSEPQNLAACHACLLVAETSCEEFNVLLDRASLVGTPDDPAAGYFSGLVT